MEQGTQLVQKGNLDQVLGEMLSKERAIVEELQKLLPSIANEEIKKGLEGRLKKAQSSVEALSTGLVPVDGYFVRVDTKSKWNKKWVKEEIENMPEAVREAWQKAEELGVFDSFSISSGSDPLLVGNKAGKHYLIAAWVNLPGGNAIGFRVR